MIKYLTVFMAILCLDQTAKGQLSQQRPDIDLIWKIKQKLNKEHPSYNPETAFKELNLMAKGGNAEAMNAIGMLYMQGWGVQQDDAEAIKCFKRAAQAGYGKAYYNWGTMYKNGDGVTQDFKKACEIFQMGAERGVSSSQYALGYMHYHGLGFAQNYPQAVRLFKLAASKKNYSAMYVLGLCYRNGYGMSEDIDSARYWLLQAAKGGSNAAKEELLASMPENITPNVNSSSPTGKGKSLTAKVQDNQLTGLPLPKVSNQLPLQHLEGLYEGYVIRYDWSGKYIIGSSKLKVELQQAGKLLTGQWTEADTLSASITASLGDSSIVFNQTTYQRSNRYSSLKSLLYEFKDASLQLLQSSDSITIAGNVRLWNVKSREPESPVYVSLTKIEHEQSTYESAPKLVSVKDLSVYPNPFNQQFTVEFYLNTDAQVSIQLIDMMGKRLYERIIQLSAGPQKQEVSPVLSAGVYVLHLKNGKEISSRLVIKQ